MKTRQQGYKSLGVPEGIVMGFVGFKNGLKITQLVVFLLQTGQQGRKQTDERLSGSGIKTHKLFDRFVVASCTNDA